MTAVMALLVSVVMFTAATLASATLDVDEIITVVLLLCAVAGFLLLLSAVASDITSERRRVSSESEQSE